MGHMPDQSCTLSCTRAGGPTVALHVSEQISSESWGFAGVAAVSRYSPLKSPVAPVALQLPGVSHVKLPLKSVAPQGGCSSYTCGCRATLCNYACTKALENPTCGTCFGKWHWAVQNTGGHSNT